MIYVDELIAWPQQAKPGAQHVFGNGRLSCHMATDGDLEELHVFAERIGLQRAWFQEHRLVDHYDLTEERRATAVQAGAIETSSRELVERCRKRPVDPPARPESSNPPESALRAAR
jgi:hypothetical protein